MTDSGKGHLVGQGYNVVWHYIAPVILNTVYMYEWHMSSDKNANIRNILKQTKMLPTQATMLTTPKMS